MHRQGLVHCDIKPNNILISPEGSVKIIDLGQSCKFGTIKSRIQGTPDYIAPEQVKRQQISHRTDIFNLGATMYWAMTGKNVPTLISQKADLGLQSDGKNFKAPHKIYRKIPRKVSKLVPECLEKQLKGKASAVLIFRPAVKYFLEDDMGLRIVFKIGKGDDLFKVSTMAVQIACNDEFPIRWQGGDVSAAVFGGIVNLLGFFAKFNCLLAHFSRTYLRKYHELIHRM